MESFYSFNYIALVLALVWNVALGMFWYSPKVFFKIWQEAEGITDEDMKGSNPAVAMAANLVTAIVTIWSLAVLANLTDVRGALAGAGLGALAAIGFVVASEVSNAAFRMTKPVVILIDAGYRLLFLAGAGALIGGWR